MQLYCLWQICIAAFLIAVHRVLAVTKLTENIFYAGLIGICILLFAEVLKF
jgi:hypothetical protein